MVKNRMYAYFFLIGGGIFSENRHEGVHLTLGRNGQDTGRFPNALLSNGADLLLQRMFVPVMECTRFLSDADCTDTVLRLP
jgi:hypothetical protein